ncbi:hypothetical protein BpHYR1_021504 [Brachionus plicatilis]|uniref:Uncharacterized protein n=1 Tax=Brachionus plicatilis TaxID=10195 RepID=A0A3M7Q0M2_BRAPC|nr:hypothetical protein BpHYR1_021504 [Brachionus plicatilis]
MARFRNNRKRDLFSHKGKPHLDSHQVISENLNDVKFDPIFCVIDVEEISSTLKRNKSPDFEEIRNEFYTSGACESHKLIFT